MSILDRLQNRSPRGEAGDSPPSRGGSGGEDQLPVPGYDRLDDKQVGRGLHELSQVELGAVETYERSHRARPAVLDKLRYMRMSEPLPGYDALTREQIAEALAGADTETIKAVRAYERKFARRQLVLNEAARVLPTSVPSAREDRTREEKAARLREGFAGRAKTAGRLAGGRRGAPPADGG